MSKNPSKTPNAKKSKTPINFSTRRQILFDLFSALQGPLSGSTSASASVAGSGLGSIDLFSEVDPELSAVPNSTSPSESDDDSVADRHYNPAKDAAVLEEDDRDDMDVDSDDPEEISPLVKK